MDQVLTKDFFSRPTLQVAEDLLGKFLVRQLGNEIVAGKITEVEAYIGEEDKACHASKGKTNRSKILYEEAGTIYVYFTYGMHWLMNIVTEEKNFPAAILVRGIEIENVPKQKTNGPAKLTKFLNITGTLNGKSATPENGLWIEDRGAKVQKIKTSPRIGIDYAGEWKGKLWRLFIESPPQKPKNFSPSCSGLDK